MCQLKKYILKKYIYLWLPEIKGWRLVELKESSKIVQNYQL